MESASIGPDREKSDILAKINTALASLGSTAKWLCPPDFLPEYQPLKGRTVLMVEDAAAVLEEFIPDLMVATGGNASGLLHINQTVEKVVEEITSENPDIVLLDYNLSTGVKGTEIAARLLEKQFQGLVVGFSSEGRGEEFAKARARGSINKNTGNPAQSVKDLAGLVA